MRKGFSIFELLITMLVTSTFVSILVQMDSAKYELINKISEQPVNTNIYIYKNIEKDFNSFNLLDHDSNFLEFKSSEECSLFYFYDNDSKTLEKYTDCNIGYCVNSCNTFKQEVKSFEVEKETENVYKINLGRKDLNNFDTYKISKLPFTVN